MVVLEYPSRTITVAFDEQVRFLRWSWWRRVRRRFVVRTLPLGLLLETLATVRALAEREGEFDLRMAVLIIAGPGSAQLPKPALETIYDAFQELNQLPKGSPPAAPAEAPTDSEPASAPSSDGSAAGPSTSTTSGSSG